MGYKYAVLGSGLQGTAAAYDMGRFGDADCILLFDSDISVALAAAAQVNALLERDVCEGHELDVRDGGAVETALSGVDSTLSAVPYFFNPSIALACIHAGSHMCDLGGNTDVTRRVLSMDDEAQAAKVCIIPDCGLAPGLANTLAVYGMSFLDETDSVQMRCGGLPQNPQPPLFYKVVFAMVGLTNEYFGNAVFLRDGKVVDVETFSDLEEIIFEEPIGRCEAFVTSGATSTCPWTFEGKVREYDYKTVRYQGHYERFKVIRDLGLLDLEPVELGETKVIPRDLFNKVAAKSLRFPDDRDLVVLRVTVKGWKDGHEVKMTFEIIDFEDEATGFSAMQRCTGWSASVIAILMARGKVKPGATSLEVAIEGRAFVDEFKLRGVRFTESMQRTVAGESAH